MAEDQKIAFVGEAFKALQLGGNRLHRDQFSAGERCQRELFGFADIDQLYRRLFFKAKLRFARRKLKNVLGGLHDSLSGQFGTGRRVVVNRFARRSQAVDRFLTRNTIRRPGQRLETFLRNVLFAAETHAERPVGNAV